MIKDLTLIACVISVCLNAYALMTCEKRIRRLERHYRSCEQMEYHDEN